MAVKAYGADFSGGRVVLALADRGRVETFAEGEVRAALERARAEVEAGRAALAVAAPAPATMMRELHTPLASAKAARVWESLLDLALPVPVEQTIWTVAGERADAGGGRRATAYALGRQDLEEAEAAWAGRGIAPTHEDAFPAVLWAAAGRSARQDKWRVAVWLGDEWVAAVGGCGGEARTWHVLRTSPRPDGAFEERFAARAAAFLDLERGPEVLWGGPGAADGELRERLESAVRRTGAAVRFGMLGGGGEALAVALARRAAEGTTVALKSGARAHPAWVARERRIAGRRRTAAAVAAAACIAACAGVLGGRAAEVRGIRDDIAAAAARLAGRPVARGAERMMLGREPLAGAIAARNEAFGRLWGGSGAGGAAEGTADALSAAAEAGAGVVRIAAGAGAVSARAEDEAGAARLEEALEARGWSAEREGSEVRGRKTP